MPETVQTVNDLFPVFGTETVGERRFKNYFFFSKTTTGAAGFAAGLSAETAGISTSQF
jgi:hypothetical protein